jgi:hypothetical protein
MQIMRFDLSRAVVTILEFGDTPLVDIESDNGNA